MPQPSVFISYAHEDKPIARVLAAGLSHRGCKVWIDEGELLAGDSVIERISVAVGETEFLVALISEYSVGSRWCRKEIALALTGELDGDEIPKVLPVRIGQAQMPETIRDKLYRTAATDRPEHAVQTIYEDILGHHRRRLETEVGSEVPGMGSAPEGTLPREPPRSVPAAAAGDQARARLVGYFADTDLIRATELLRQERRIFMETAREAITSAEADSPGPEIDFERFRQLEVELARCLERRFESLFPLVQYGPESLIRVECQSLAELVDANWGRSSASYAEWSTSPRWLVSVVVLAMGGLACSLGRFAVVKDLWTTRSRDGGPLPSLELLTADGFATALELARFGKRLRLGVFWHTAALLAASDTCVENYYEVAPVLEAALHQLARFSWLCSALAGRDDVELVHWWTGVSRLAGEDVAPRMERLLMASPEDRRIVCHEIFGLKGNEDDVLRLDEWARTASGPRP